MRRIQQAVVMMVITVSSMGVQAATPIPTGKTDVYLRHWLLVGPLPRFAPEDKMHDLKPGEFCWGFTHDFLQAQGGEAVIAPTEGMPLTFGGKTLKWKTYTSDTNNVLFDKVWGKIDDFVGYAYCEVESPIDTDALLAVGSDDGVKVWVNHRQVLANHIARALTPDQDLVTVSLHKGRNPILIKVFDIAEECEFTARLIVNDTATKSAFYMKRLTTRQDRYVTASDREAIHCTAGFEQGMSDPNFPAVVQVRVTDPSGAVHALKKSYRLNEPIPFSGAQGPGYYPISLTVTAPDKSTSEISSGFACIPDLAKYKDMDKILAGLKPGVDRAIDERMRVNLEIRSLGIKQLLAGPVGSSGSANALWVLTRQVEGIVQAQASGQDYFKNRPGSRIEAYRSGIDGSLQPYGVSIPKNYDPTRKHPLTISLHGFAGPSYTREVFIIGGSQSLTASESPYGMIFVSIYGRGNTSYRGLGENDVLCVLDEVMRHYSIDATRVYLTGFSMGGGGTWYLSNHYPDRFAAVAPMAGYCDYRTADWSRDIKPWALPSSRLYMGAVEMAENFLHVPQFIFHGDQDQSVSVAHSRSMAKRLKELEYDVIYKECPGLGHVCLTDGFGLGEWFMMHAQNPIPSLVKYRTASLRHNRVYWVTVDRMQKSMEIAAIEAAVKARDRIEVTTQNIEQFTLQLRPELLDRSKPITLSINQKTILTILPTNTPEISVDYAGGTWRYPAQPVGGLIKNHDTPGLLDDVFHHRFIFVYGTAGDAAETQLNRAAATDLCNRMTGADWDQIMGIFAVIPDTEVTEAVAEKNHLILVGRPASNKVAASIINQLPVRFDGKSVTALQTHHGDDVMVLFIHPNPRFPHRYVVLFYAVTPKQLVNMRWERWLSPDYMIFRPNRDPKKENRYEVLEAGVFDTHWRLQPLPAATTSR